MKYAVCDLEGKDEHEIEKREKKLYEKPSRLSYLVLLPRIHPLPTAMKGHMML